LIYYHYVSGRYTDICYLIGSTQQRILYIILFWRVCTSVIGDGWPAFEDYKHDDNNIHYSNIVSLCFWLFGWRSPDHHRYMRALRPRDATVVYLCFHMIRVVDYTITCSICSLFVYSSSGDCSNGSDPRHSAHTDHVYTRECVYDHSTLWRRLCCGLSPTNIRLVCTGPII